MPDSLSDLHARYDGPIPEHLRNAALRAYLLPIRNGELACLVDRAIAYGQQLGEAAVYQRLTGDCRALGLGTYRDHYQEAWERAADGAVRWRGLLEQQVRDVEEGL